MAFSFGFSEDAGSDEESISVALPDTHMNTATAGHLVAVKAHKFEDLVGSAHSCA